MTKEYQKKLSSLAETERLASAIATHARPPLVVALNGTLGAGKTQLVRFAAQSLGVPAIEVTSPTYVLMQRYQGRKKAIFHLDFYRLKSEAEVWDLGFDEITEQPALVFVEWAEKFPNCLPQDHLQIQLTVDSENQRLATVTSHGVKSAELISKLS